MSPVVFWAPLQRTLSLTYQRGSCPHTLMPKGGAKERAVAREDKLLWEASASDTLPSTDPEILPLHEAVQSGREPSHGAQHLQRSLF